MINYILLLPCRRPLDCLLHGPVENFHVAVFLAKAHNLILPTPLQSNSTVLQAADFVP
jgi:hypothetical protein